MKKLASQALVILLGILVTSCVGSRPDKGGAANHTPGPLASAPSPRTPLKSATEKKSPGESKPSADQPDFWNGLPPCLSVVDGDGQGDFAGHVLAHPLVVQLANQNGALRTGAKVHFTILSGGGKLTPVAAGVTDSDGKARATLKLPMPVGATVTVAARYHGVQVTFTATVGDPNTDPVAPSQPQVESAREATDATITWEDRSDNENGFYVERSADDVTWSRIATLPANTTSFHDTGLKPYVTYGYRIVSFNNAFPYAARRPAQ